MGTDLHDVGRTRRVANLRHSLTPLLEFLEDPQIVDIMLNADGAVWVDRMGAKNLEFTGVWLDGPSAERILSGIAGELELELHAGRPTLACKLPVWGARVQALVPPVTTAPIIAFRKPTSAVLTLEHYVDQGILSTAQAGAFREAVSGRANILIGGGTGSGKTTFANALLQEIATSKDRLLIIEDTPELRCADAHRVDLLVHPPLYTWRHAVMDAMRLRPDRIIVGEVRDGAALDLLKAMNTGHPGSIATIHANSTTAMLDRFCQLVDEVIPQYPRKVVASTINVCVHISRDRAHPAGRVVTGVDRVLGFDDRDGWQLEPLAR